MKEHVQNLCEMFSSAEERREIVCDNIELAAMRAGELDSLEDDYLGCDDYLDDLVW